MTSYVLTVSCKSTRGIVAAISSYLADKGCNIVELGTVDDVEIG
ncbi:formyltetrahydrofolate deformylase, partial [Rhizobium ruizarguesonis]